MQKIDNNMKAYLHNYEAYRVPKGTMVKDALGKDVVLSEEKDVLVLTEKSGKQLIEDRRDYGGMLQMKAEVAAQAIAQRMKKEIEKKKSEWDEKEEAEQQKKMDELCEASNEAALAVGTGSHDFSAAQKQHIVEVDSSEVDFSTLTAVNLGAGVIGTNIDLSL